VFPNQWNIRPVGLYDKCDKIRADFWLLIQRTGIIESLLWGTLVDVLHGKPFIEFGGYKWDRIDQGNECIDFPALIMTRNLAFEDSYDDKDRKKPHWKGCTLRAKLNGSFLDELELSLFKIRPDLTIKLTTIETSAKTGREQFVNPDNAMTEDKVFLLSEKEIREYFHLPCDWRSNIHPQSYSLVAVENESAVNDNHPYQWPSWWWLRSCHAGFRISPEGTIDDYTYAFDEVNGVRPALWIAKRYEDKQKKNIGMSNNASSTFIHSPESTAAASNKKVFISYAWNDCDKDEIERLTVFLRSNNIEVICDFDYKNRPPQQGWYNWMLDGIEVATEVLCVCGSTWYSSFRKTNTSSSGATYEGSIINANLYGAKGTNNKFFPIILNSSVFEFIPDPLVAYNNNICLKEHTKILNLINSPVVTGI
jgi:hypothetical protein